jgi:hypothetical protein
VLTFIGLIYVYLIYTSSARNNVDSKSFTPTEKWTKLDLASYDGSVNGYFNGVVNKYPKTVFESHILSGKFHGRIKVDDNIREVIIYLEDGKKGYFNGRIDDGGTYYLHPTNGLYVMDGVLVGSGQNWSVEEGWVKPKNKLTPNFIIDDIKDRWWLLLFPLIWIAARYYYVVRLQTIGLEESIKRLQNHVPMVYHIPFHSLVEHIDYPKSFTRLFFFFVEDNLKKDLCMVCFDTKTGEFFSFRRNIDYVIRKKMWDQVIDRKTHRKRGRPKKKEEEEDGDH